MISILIPIYNEVVVALVRDLQQQCDDLALTYEIICMDDHSQPEYRRQNAELGQRARVRYLELEVNIGRARIRNQLADLAAYAYLLFMDGDSRVIRTDYIRNYLEHLQPERVIYGGRVYQREPPVEPAYYLHWHYGCRREALNVEQRRLHPARTFMTNNFVVPRAIAGRIRFDESIRRYGYEDTLYALELEKAGIAVQHLDNPLEHQGLEEQEVFLRKTRDALDNLRELLPRHPEIDTRLLVAVRKLEQWHLRRLARLAAPLLMPILRGWLYYPRVPLKVLDLYKLFYFLKQ